MFEPINAALAAHGERKTGDSYRLFHGRGHCYPGLEFVTLDWFDPLLSVTLFAEPPAGWLAPFTELLLHHPALADCPQILIAHRYNQQSQWLRGGEQPVQARRGALRFLLSPGEQQNVGFFLDMEPGRQWLEQHCQGKRVLNLFAYTCAFSVVALAAGAQSVVNVDMSRSALARGRDNHRLNDLPLNAVTFLGENILKSWGRIRRAGPYDLIILDPPSFQKGSFVAHKDYGKLVRRLPELLPEGGQVLACLNAPELNTDFLREQFERLCPQARLVARLQNHPDFPDANVERALKLMHFSLPAVALSDCGIDSSAPA